MPATVKDILDIIEIIAPAKLAESWDNVGLMIGRPTAPVDKILLGLDPTPSLLDEATALDSNVVITHHPIIFHPLKSVQLEQPDGRFIDKAIRKKINIISCHTNLDSTSEGVSDALARQIGLEQTEPLVAYSSSENTMGLGRIGNLPTPIPPADFIERLKAACSPPWLLGAGSPPEQITRVAICGGSCSELAETALRHGAQVFVTAEVKHSIARWAEQAGLWIIDAGHFATENPAMKQFARQLAEETEKHFDSIDIIVTMQQRSALNII